jgi:hypothetical protein
MQDGFLINSLSEFFHRIKEIQTEWSNLDGNFIYPWFRGLVSDKFKLLPGLYRNEKDIENEHSYREDFAEKAFPFLADSTFGVPSSDWEWYFLMQHYGLPTRLLDWSEGALIALYFALFYKREKDDTNPCVWMLNPYEFNRIFHEMAETFQFTHEKVIDYLPPVWRVTTAAKPIAIRPVYKSKRIAVQKGVFTIHGFEKTPLDEIPDLEDCLKKITVNYDEMELIKAELQMAGITESSLFPELSGLAAELRAYWG